MIKINKLLPVLVIISFFLGLFPIGYSVTVDPSVEFVVGNETYGFNHTMNFSSIVIGGSGWIRFNNTDFNVTSANPIYINLSYLHENISLATDGIEVLDFIVNCSSGFVYFNLSGFTPSVQYSVERNDTEIATPTANASGVISFNNSVWTYKHFEIYSATLIPITKPPINGTTEDPYVELYGYCSIGLDATNFSADIYADVFAPVNWTVDHVYMKFFTNNSILDRNVTATSYTQVNSTYRRYYYEYNPSNTLSGLDMGWFDVNVTASAYNTTHIYDNYTFFDDVFQVYKLNPPTNISCDYSGTTNTINLSWMPSSDSSLVIRPNAAGDLTELAHVGDTPNWECVDEAVHDGSTTFVAQNFSNTKIDLYNLDDHTTENGTITLVTVNAVIGCPSGSGQFKEARIGVKIDGTSHPTSIGNIAETWTNYSVNFSVNPTTYVAWSWDDIDDLQAYVHMHSWDTFTVGCSQIYVIVDYTEDALIGDTSTDSIVIVRNNDSYPVCPYDGYEVQNGTLNYYNTSVSFDETYFSLFAYNDTTMSYSEHVEMEWGVLGFSCYNESNPSQGIGFDIEITNSDASIVYTANDLVNTHYIDLNDIPYGDDTIFVISNSSYRQRVYYYDLVANQFYNYTFYLPPIETSVDPGGGDDGGNTTATILCLVSVVDELEQPIPNADVQIRRYINTTDSYQNISTLITDGNGQVSIWLVPNVLYYFDISKDGFVQTGSKNWIPSSLLYTKIFMLEYEEIDPQEPDVEPEVIIFEGYISGGVLYINYSDSLSQTVDTRIYIYEINLSTGTETLYHTDIRTGVDSFQESVAINTTNTYKAILYYNHTTFGVGTQKKTLVFTGIITALTTPAIVNNLFESNYGVNPLGWSNTIMFLFVVAGFFYADQKDAGKILILLGGLFIFINVMIGFNSTISVAAGGVIPILFIIVGVIVTWNDSRKKVV